MFVYCIQKDTIRVEPKDFGKDPVDAIREEIHRRYANKIVPDVGLCISLLDILDTSEGAVLYGDGCYYYKTEFRLVIFRPYMGEALIGKVKSMDENGLRITLGFFDDIYVAPAMLPEYSTFDPSRRAYFWIPSGDNPPDRRPTANELMCKPDDEKLYIERKEWVRIRVEEEFFNDVSPTSGKAPPPPPAPNPDGSAPQPPVVESAERDAQAPYRINCSMTESGTGVLYWWDEDGEEEEGAEEGDEG